MKRAMPFVFLVLAVLLIYGCKRNSTEQCRNAALSLYCKYADNEDLTVAYLGDFKIKGNPIDAVMIQAKGDEEWEWLKNEFSVPKRVFDDEPEIDENATFDVTVQKTSMMQIDENIFLKEHVSDEEVEYFAQNIVDELNAALNSLITSGAEVKRASVLISDDMSFMDNLQQSLQFRDETAIGRILQRVTDKLNGIGLTHNDSTISANTVYIRANDSLTEEQQSRINTIKRGQSLLLEATDFGQIGYVIAVEGTDHALWIFFYKNLEECSHILELIRTDIFTFSDDMNKLINVTNK